MFCILLIYFIVDIASGQIYGLYRFNEQQKRQIITIHNKMRALEPASNMQELVWDERLANLAFGHVQRCNAWHRSAFERRGYGYSYIGENIWWSNEAFLRADLKPVMLDFYNEKPFYNYYTTACWQGAQCGHYTQFVWATTCAVGCAAVHCNGIRNGRGIIRGHIVVCNYGEGGNKYGQRPFLMGRRCSQCPCGGCTSERLCAPCCSGVRYPENYLPIRPVQLVQPQVKPWLAKTGVAQKEKSLQLYNYTCIDLEPNCQLWAQNNGCTRNYAFMSRRCPRTCNTCTSTASIVNQARGCADNNRHCYWWAARGECRGTFALYMTANCRYSCRLCTPTTSKAKRSGRSVLNHEEKVPVDSFVRIR